MIDSIKGKCTFCVADDINNIVVMNVSTGIYETFTVYALPVDPSELVFQTDCDGNLIDLEDLEYGDTYDEYEFCICNTFEDALNEVDMVQDCFYESVAIVELEQRGASYYPLRIVS